MTIRTIINDNPAEYDFDGIKKKNVWAIVISKNLFSKNFCWG